MGESIVRGLVNAGTDKKSIHAYDIKDARITSAKRAYGITIVKDPRTLVKQSDYIILAIKPQDAKPAIQAVGPFIDDSKILISIMAGITTSSITSMLEKQAKVVRVMPNVCLSVAEGAMGMAANYLLSSNELNAVESLFSPLGTVIQVAEEQMDAVTALSGSGPAFVLSFIEGLIDAGVKMGLARDKSASLALQTIKGTITMLEQEKLHPVVMKEMVTSPGGTTVAGLLVLDEKGFKGNIIRALEAAQIRARELSK